MKHKMLYLAVLSALTLTSCALSFGTTSTDDSSTGSSDTSGDSTSSDTGADTSSGTSSGTSGNISSNPSAETSSSTSTVTEGWDNYYKASSVDPNFNLQDLKQAGNVDAIPSPRTDINILVIPIEFTGYTFASNTLTDIETLFNGTADQTNYWESVSSFYEKSSYGNLDLSFNIAPKYATGYTPTEAASLDTTDTDYFSTNIVREAVGDYKSDNGSNSTQQFDADGNGYIDAVWMIYSCPDYSNSQTIKNISTDYWAYVFWDYKQSASTSSPNQNSYAWASHDFMYEGGGTSKIDAHTFIHETGHLLGLDDYYNYDSFDSDYTGINKYYKPTGGIDMMDYNVTDHNVWSKMALGWTKPYVVTGNAEITIDPAESSGDVILIADSWNGTSYDEFLILELYTPTGLNGLDSSMAYSDDYPIGYTIPGIRLYHVDSRIGNFTYSYSNEEWYFDSYYEPSSLYLSGSSYYGLAHSNTPSRSADENHRLIHMIQAGGTNTFDTGGEGSNADLFTTGQTFSMDTYGSQFFKNGNKLNNGNALGYTISFSSVSSESATIRIEKI